ncbi:C-type lectin domain family 10 member A-like [Crotalus tigris]|uniref:C-type lectin domain family 10 member A-like n=1 Tax=Crotalus tigris TaxID=88082 RepID=UPI00192FA448|nr:C-type lectin domain family 10 member A-like [Crotalus tigris]
MAGFAPQDSWRQRVCSARQVTLVLMGLLAVVTLSITVFGFVGRKYSTTLWKMQEDLKAINRTIAAELAALQQNETNNEKTLEKINQLEIQVTKEKRKVMPQFQDRIKKLQRTLQRLTYEVENTEQKWTGPETGCCPQGWHLFQQSCYWLSSVRKSWPEAKQDCEGKEAHLLIITSYEERQFVFQLTKRYSVWIGLKNNGRTWKWVDGTPYTVRWSDWLPNHPAYSDNFCTETYYDGLWAHVFCHLNSWWLCEMQALQCVPGETLPAGPP